MLSTPPAFVLSQDQTLVFNPQSGVLVSQPSRSKLISELTVVLPSLLCIVFKVLPRPPFRERLNIITLPPPPVNTFFLIFLIFFVLFSIYKLIIILCPDSYGHIRTFVKHAMAYVHRTCASASVRVWAYGVYATLIIICSLPDVCLSHAFPQS